MKNIFNLSHLILATLLASLPILSFAKGGSDGGGGDSSEIRVDEIRQDILKWIDDRGAKGLNLPAPLTYRDYVANMTNILEQHAVVVTFVSTEQENVTTDPELKVYVNGRPKSCRGFMSVKDNLPHILCNIERFPKNSAEQYRLVHHEYAGLAGIEKNVGASSDYEISNQLSDYLRFEKVLRLSVIKGSKIENTTFSCLKGLVNVGLSLNGANSGYMTTECEKASKYQVVPNFVGCMRTLRDSGLNLEYSTNRGMAFVECMNEAQSAAQDNNYSNCMMELSKLGLDLNGPMFGIATTQCNKK